MLKLPAAIPGPRGHTFVFRSGGTSRIHQLLHPIRLVSCANYFLLGPFLIADVPEEAFILFSTDYLISQMHYSLSYSLSTKSGNFIKLN